MTILSPLRSVAEKLISSSDALHDRLQPARADILDAGVHLRRKIGDGRDAIRA